MKKKIIIAGITAAILIAGAGIFCVSAGNRENDKKTEITQMTEAESETEPITEVETTTESVAEAQTEAPTEQVTEPQTEQAEVDTFYDDTIDTYSYEEEDDNGDSAPADTEPADTQPVYEEPEPVYTEPDYSEPVSEDTDSGNTGVDNSQEDFYEDDDEEPYYGDESAYAAKLAEEIKDNIQPEDYDKIDWADRIGSQYYLLPPRRKE